MTSERYINFFTDFGFKKLFGSEPNKDLLLAFLNALLGDLAGTITSLQFRRTDQLGNGEPDRRAVFDLYCENDCGEKFIVELQKAKQKFFKDRSLFYATFPIQEQAVVGEWDFQLKAVYTIAILDFVFDDDVAIPEKYLYTVRLADLVTNRVFYDKLTFVYVEMPKFNKKLTELTTPLDKWLFAIKNLNRLDRVPEALHDAVFERFFALAEIARLDPSSRQSYENSLKYYRDLNNVIATARDEAVAQLTTAYELKLDHASRQKEQAERQKEQAEQQKESVIATAVAALVAVGMSESAARHLFASAPRG